MAKIRKIEPVMPTLPTRKKVAAYARVSMETERLHHSLSAQISYYSDLIQRNPEWEYAGVYADDGITGTKANSREEFQRMLEDCEAGNIDIILTKSISRFARNTVDLLETVRRLKELGVSVRFEKENIDSLSGDGEVMLTLLASFAQEEITSLSNNVKWGIRKRFEKGIPNFRNKILGYEWEDDHLVVVPEEAAIRDGAARDRAARQGKEIPQRSPRFSSKIKCGECGCWYGSKVWHSNSKYRKVIWRCNHKYDGDKTCRTPHLTDEEIQAAFLKAVNKLLETKDAVVANGYAMIPVLFDTTALEAEHDELL